MGWLNSRDTTPTRVLNYCMKNKLCIVCYPGSVTSSDCWKGRGNKWDAHTQTCEMKRYYTDQGRPWINNKRWYHHAILHTKHAIWFIRGTSRLERRAVDRFRLSGAIVRHQHYPLKEHNATVSLWLWRNSLDCLYCSVP